MSAYLYEAVRSFIVFVGILYFVLAIVWPSLKLQLKRENETSTFSLFLVPIYDFFLTLGILQKFITTFIYPEPIKLWTKDEVKPVILSLSLISLFFAGLFFWIFLGLFVSLGIEVEYDKIMAYVKEASPFKLYLVNIIGNVLILMTISSFIAIMFCAYKKCHSLKKLFFASVILIILTSLAPSEEAYIAMTIPELQRSHLVYPYKELIQNFDMLRWLSIFTFFTLVISIPNIQSLFAFGKSIGDMLRILKEENNDNGKKGERIILLHILIGWLFGFILWIIIVFLFIPDKEILLLFLNRILS